MQHFQYLIIGGGVAGHRAAEEIRKRDAAGTIALISEETHPLYSRVLLPHYLHGKVPRERVFFAKPEWYAAQRIEWLPGRRAVKVDDAPRAVTLDDGTAFSYEKLLVATGGAPRALPFTHPRLACFRTIDDADLILRYAAECATLGREPKLAVYGSGFIALEFVNFFAARGWKPTVFFRGEKFWERELSHEASERLEALMRSRGITIKPATTLEQFAAAAKDFDFVGVGIGLNESIGFLGGTGVQVKQGVIANAELETSVPGIWTAGDVAEFDDLTSGRQRVIGNWMNAEMQGRLAGAAMAGERKTFRLVSSYATKLLDQPVIFIGDTAKGPDVTIESATGEKGIVERHLRDGRLIGAVLVGDSSLRAALTKEIGEGK